MRFWLACLVAATLAACVELPSRIDESPALGPPLDRFSAAGRISLRQGERRDHLRFRWEHEPGSDVVMLMSPLGQGIAELTRDAAGARLVQPNQPLVIAASLPELAQRVVGAPLPLEALADWLRGARAESRGEVDGWQVVVSDSSAYRQRRLLRVMEARRDDVELKLIVDDWDVPE